MRNSEIGKEVIKKQLPLIPKLPGVYKMLSINNEILYVGKAKNLPNRLKSYVSEKNHIIRTERMLSQTKKLEITTTSNESEALLLEANLIKKHKENKTGTKESFRPIKIKKDNIKKKYETWKKN